MMMMMMMKLHDVQCGKLDCTRLWRWSISIWNIEFLDFAHLPDL